jgi:hypothetical protein
LNSYAIGAGIYPARASKHALADGVVRLEAGARCGRFRVAVTKQAVHQEVACAREPPPEHPLLGVSELPRHGNARDVRRLYADLDPVDAAQLKRDARERGGGLGRQALADAAGSDPVADLERALADARVEPSSADDLRLVAAEDSVDEVLAAVEVAAEAAADRGRPTASTAGAGRDSSRRPP